MAWGPFQPGESEKGQLPWTATLIYVHGVDSGEKDATVEVLGVGNQIQGNRSDLIILDDCVVGTNANEYEKQIYWLESEVESRVETDVDITRAEIDADICADAGSIAPNRKVRAATVRCGFERIRQLLNARGNLGHSIDAVASKL